jgi:uncharacterized glyoxalase superfamily protein PhnB
MMEKKGLESSWAQSIFAITLFQEDLAAAKVFYQKVFEFKPVWEDANSCVFKIGETMINLLDACQADELLSPAKMAGLDAGARAVYTIHVEDVDGLCVKLKANGVTLINGPMDRPWGIRTASFADPAGNVWEVAK